MLAEVVSCCWNTISFFLQIYVRQFAAWIEGALGRDIKEGREEDLKPWAPCRQVSCSRGQRRLCSTITNRAPCSACSISTSCAVGIFSVELPVYRWSHKSQMSLYYFLLQLPSTFSAFLPAFFLRRTVPLSGSLKRQSNVNWVTSSNMSLMSHILKRYSRKLYLLNFNLQ